MSVGRLILLFGLFVAAQAPGEGKDVRALLSAKCVECHGPAKAKGKLRLDGVGVVDGVELLRRVRSAVPDEVMPPEDSGKTLTEKEIEALEKWVAGGGKWARHWAFEVVTKPEVPGHSRGRNPIDAFWGNNPEPVSEDILRRRLAFDLLGLPPRGEDEGRRVEELVDVYLAAPEFGERMALWWLDLVRYADSEGYFYDYTRNVYPYRDWVISAFNANKRFDRFTLEQLAGDLLGESGWEARVASGYNRLIMTTQEDGANEADYRARYAADRVKNFGSVWLGLTLGCAQCHDHKTDPITAADFYRTAAFFADVKEEAVLKQEEIFLIDETPEYQELLEQTKRVKEKLKGIEGEADKALVYAVDEMRESGLAVKYWPKGRKTEEMLRVALKADPTSAEERTLRAYFRRHFQTKLSRELLDVGKARQKFETGAARTLVTERGEPRTVRVLARGDWMDETGPEAEPGFLESLGGKCESTKRMDRRDLARWLTSRENPLTAKVFVNRLWALFFREGLAASLDDLGTQTATPARKDLLDWLSAEFMESGWDVKHLVRLLATSEAYRGKRPGIFLSAEMLRDNALAVAGLLSERRGGEPVRTYLPSEFLNARSSLNEEYLVDSGERLYRRSVYLQRMRALTHPALVALNASSREECVSQRAEARTPHEALALLNAPEFVEVARAFAERIYLAAPDDAGRLAAAVKMALGRDGRLEEIEILAELLKAQRKEFSENRISAAQFLRTGTYRWPENISAEELASWTNVARALLNLEETHSKY